jgi:phosphotransferase system HPr (HPr) family protein
MAPMGLHLRSAALLAKTASRYDSRITVRRNERQADAKSVLSVVMLEAAFGATVVVEAEGRDADNAMMAVGGLFAAGFPETDAPAPGMPRPARNRTLDAAGVPS